MTALTEWQNFYVIVGSAAGALIGLQFVVMALVAGLPAMTGRPDGAAAYLTPTVVHFGTALLLAGVMSAPWHAMAPVAVAWGLAGAAGAVYTAVVIARMRRLPYKPEFEDWAFNAVLPLAAYGALMAAAWVVFAMERAALFGVAGATAVLLAAGIHNAWDTVTFHVFVKRS
jgi:hypothetical protein